MSNTIFPLRCSLFTEVFRTLPFYGIFVLKTVVNIVTTIIQLVDGNNEVGRILSK